MTSRQTLLAELAPNGVPYPRLGDLASLGSARVPAGVLDVTTYVGVDNLLPNFGGRRDAGYGLNSSGAIAFEVGDILIGNIRPYLKKVWLADRPGGASPDVLVVSIDRMHRNTLLPRFLYFVLACGRFIDYSMRHAKGAKMPRGSKVAILDYRVPVPPLEVQREIVRILDHFTGLEAELEAKLEAELEARRRQYAYYRHEILSAGDAGLTRPLGDLAKNLDGRRRPVTKEARVPGEIPYYGASGVVDYVSDHIFDGDYLLVSEDGANLLARSTPIAFSISGKSWVNNHAHVLEFDSYAERRFVEIYLNSIDLSPFVTGAAQPKLNKANLNQIPIPDVPLAEKEQAVEVFDKFDALVNNLSIGLSAELAARRKQYEYYRDKLLTFEELV